VEAFENLHLRWPAVWGRPIYSVVCSLAQLVMWRDWQERQQTGRSAQCYQCRTGRRAAGLLLPTTGRMSADLADRLSCIVNMNVTKNLIQKSLSACMLQ